VDEEVVDDGRRACGSEGNTETTAARATRRRGRCGGQRWAAHLWRAVARRCASESGQAVVGRRERWPGGALAASGGRATRGLGFGRLIGDRGECLGRPQMATYLIPGAYSCGAPGIRAPMARPSRSGPGKVYPWPIWAVCIWERSNLVEGECIWVGRDWLRYIKYCWLK
jgi:hypothetical protein